MRPLVVTDGALNVLASLDFAFDEICYENVARKSIGTAVVVVESEGIYVLTAACTESSQLLVIKRSPTGLFDVLPSDERRSVFDRCARIAMHSFNQAIALNPRWMSHHEGNRFSVFARGIGHDERLAAEIMGPALDVYIFDFAPAGRLQKLSECTPDYEIYRTAKAAFPGILERTRFDVQQDLDGQIELEQIDPNAITKGYSYDDWVPKLSQRQREFFDYPVSGPVRLRGEAGTGKTLAMVMKVLRTRYEADKSGPPIRILFATHSWAMAEYVDNLIHQIDQQKDTKSTIDVFPLLTVAQQKDYRAIGLQPLGLDSEEGKSKALKEIGEILEEFMASDWIAYHGGCSDLFIEQIEAPLDDPRRRGLQWDLLIEFGCVLAAEGNLGHQGDLDKYLRVVRRAWMMQLETQAEKEVVFALWGKFVSRLRKRGLIASDQIISDLLNELSTFYWDAARIRDGYDVVFVDEMHLFNAQERLIFHHLLRDANIAPKVIMALDPKQSPREVFTAVTVDKDTRSTNIYDRARLPNSQRIDLVDVYRYTPEINRLIRDVANAAPALALPEADVPEGRSVAASGPLPELFVVPTKARVLRKAVELAREHLKDARKRRGRVAILAVDDTRFTEYLPAAKNQYEKVLFIIAARDDIEKLRFSRGRIIFSTPEYVAGQQFDTVILMDVNKDLVPEGKYKGL